MDGAPAEVSLVPLNTVHPHELADRTREARIEARLRVDDQLRDPLMVGTVPHFDGYVLLDGTNRLSALGALGLSYALVQSIDYSDAGSVSLKTWGHSADVSFESLVDESAEIAGVSVHPVAELGASDILAVPATLAVVFSADRIVALVRDVESEHSRAEQLHAFVDLYEHRMTRVDCDISNAEEVAQTVCESPEGARVLVAFPPITRSQVAIMAMRRALIPAGITRHVIMTGRALRVNVPLSMLKSDRALSDAQDLLRCHLATLHPRVYREPTILYDS